MAFARQLVVTAQDDSLDVLDMLIRDLLARSASSGKKARLRTLRDLDAAALSLAEISEKVITPSGRMNRYGVSYGKTGQDYRGRDHHLRVGTSSE